MQNKKNLVEELEVTIRKISELNNKLSNIFIGLKSTPKESIDELVEEHEKLTKKISELAENDEVIQQMMHLAKEESNDIIEKLMRTKETLNNNKSLLEKLYL